MTSFKLDRQRASAWHYCWRCAQLGIDTPTIAPESEYIVTIIDGKTQDDKTCMDCFNRAVEEIRKESE